MSEAVDVGSVLGGRYKVTAYVLASADKDLVLEGVDQVLNRPVSILVASADNASHVTATARELAAGERDENIQVLDLSISDSGTYLVTNRAPAADMLDLIVQREVQPEADAPYVEPFFTDTLGSELFGQARSTDPEDHEDYDDEYEVEDEAEDDETERRPSRLAALARRFGRPQPEDTPDDDDQDETRSEPSAAAPPVTPRSSTHSVPPPPSHRPGGATAASAPDPSASSSGSDARSAADSDDDRGEDRRAASAGAAAAIAGAGAASQRPERAASYFPLSDYLDDDPDEVEDSDEYDEYEDGDGGGRRFTRLLVGAVLAVGIIAAVVFAATTLGGLNSGNTPVADPGSQGQVTSEPAAPETTDPAPPSAAPAPEPVLPVVSGISRVVPDNQALDAGNDINLPLVIDGDPATFWGNQVYASDTFGGLASNLALILELEQESTISEVSITQISGTGGTFSVLLNDQPTLEGAEQVAQGSFTAPTISVPVPENGDGGPTAQYVIVNFTQLPRLDIQAQFPFGLRIAEIDVN